MKPNPLNFFDIRKLDFPGSHLEYMEITPNYNIEQAISNWIMANLKSRFYVGKNLTVNEGNEVTSKLKIGFEDPKELSYFALACPHLKYK
jgi:hypothetical protein|tara:strand:- start:2097 stop:2366 length:270 start_codon:yes stop_codon:yes gene_type:complete